MSRAPRWAVPLLFLVLLAGFAAGIWGSFREAFPGKGLYRVTGVFANRWGETMILVKHEAIPGLMDEMSSMSFFAESRELLDRADLHPGDRIRFTIRQLPDKLLVVEIQKLR
ncbi:MAG TPA: copper-binding protein [Methylomirabilota bacterium]|nr:copper-binding protein [Methylomirabilota bacterium]